TDNLADQTALRHDLVTLLQRGHHLAMLLHPLLLRSDHQEIHDRKDQYQRNELSKGSSAGTTGGLCVGRSSEHSISFRLSDRVNMPDHLTSWRATYLCGRLLARNRVPKADLRVQNRVNRPPR